MLINLQTNLKDLKYGKDRPGGGDSNQPYIRTTISQGNSLPKGGPDSILRGGILAPIRAVNDVSRLTQMFFDTRSLTGLLFTTKQNLLSRTSVKTEASKGIGYAGGTINQGAYLPTSTIAQAGVGFTGTHLNLLGLDPSSPMRGDKPGMFPTLGLNRYEDVIKTQTHESLFTTTPQNRLLKYREEHITQKSEGPLDIYQGGPGSILGVGNTIIPFTQRTGINSPDVDFNSLIPSELNISIRENDNNSELDFRKNKINESDTYKRLISSPNYRTSNIEQRVNSGDPGKAAKYQTSSPYSIQAPQDALDKINALPLYDSLDGLEEGVSTNDLVKFRIASISNTKPNSFIYMHFRAYIDSFNDGYNATWNPSFYVGRGEAFYNYLNFERGIDLSFTVAAQSKAELIPMYKKLNYLASTVAPEYSKAGFMMGNLLKLTMGGYLYEQPGILLSLNYTIPEESPWEIGLSENGGFDDSVKELPHIIKVTGFRFIPIQNFLPQKVENLIDTQERYIALSNSEGQGNYIT